MTFFGSRSARWRSSRWRRHTRTPRIPSETPDEDRHVTLTIVFVTITAETETKYQHVGGSCPDEGAACRRRAQRDVSTNSVAPARKKACGRGFGEAAKIAPTRRRQQVGGGDPGIAIEPGELRDDPRSAVPTWSESIGSEQCRELQQTGQRADKPAPSSGARSPTCGTWSRSPR